MQKTIRFFRKLAIIYVLFFFFIGNYSCIGKALKDTIYIPYEWQIVKKTYHTQNGINGIRLLLKTQKGELVEKFMVCSKPASRSFQIKRWLSNDIMLKFHPAESIFTIIGRQVDFLANYKFMIYALIFCYLFFLRGTGLENIYYRIVH